MRSKNRPSGRSFIEEKRRAQIVACAIETIATLGYARASLAQIAERAGISKSVISYHFAGKEELVEAVLAEIFSTAQAKVRPQIAAESTATGKVHAYINGRIGLLKTHRDHLLAVAEIWVGLRTDDGRLRMGAAEQEPELAALQQIFEQGRRDGEFRPFSTRVMAVSLRQAIDGALLEVAAHPDLDLDDYAAELVALFDHATQPPTRGKP
jgi:TetR/AcrR family fatty acid metabolism transcriptional regulator